MCDSHYDNNDFLRREAFSKCLYMCQNWEPLEMSYSSYWSQLSWAPELPSSELSAARQLSVGRRLVKIPRRRQGSSQAARPPPPHRNMGEEEEILWSADREHREKMKVWVLYKLCKYWLLKIIFTHLSHAGLVAQLQLCAL